MNYLREYFKHAKEDYEFVNYGTERYIHVMRILLMNE